MELALGITGGQHTDDPDKGLHMPFRVLCVGLVVAIVACDPAPPRYRSGIEETAQSVQKIAEITIVTPNGWSIRIRQSGSGQVGFGASMQDFAPFPNGTFEFGPLHQQLRPLCTERGSLATDYAVSFVHLGATSTRAHYCKDAQAVRSIFSWGVSAADKKGTRLAELYRSNPPVPPE
jgi:hypothetical protein